MPIKMFLTVIMFCFCLILSTVSTRAQSQYDFAKMRPVSTEAKIAYENGWRNQYDSLTSKIKDEPTIERLIETSIAEFSKTIEIEPEFAPAYFRRGKAYYERAKFHAGRPSNQNSSKTNDTTAAINDLSQAIAIVPNYGDPFYSRAIVYRFANRFEEALGDLAKYIEIQKQEGAQDLVAYAYHFRFAILVKMREFDRALADADESIKYFTKPEITEFLIASYTHRVMIYQAKGDTANSNASMLAREKIVKIFREQRQKQLEKRK